MLLLLLLFFIRLAVATFVIVLMVIVVVIVIVASALVWLFYCCYRCFYSCWIFLKRRNWTRDGNVVACNIFQTQTPRMVASGLLSFMCHTEPGALHCFIPGMFVLLWPLGRNMNDAVDYGVPVDGDTSWNFVQQSTSGLFMCNDWFTAHTFAFYLFFFCTEI